jgi:hypothetical protein
MQDYRICGHSAIGKSHKDKGIKCQDYYYFAKGNGFVVAAVADGVSSSKHSDVASRTAVKESVQYCADRIRQEDDAKTILKTIEKAFDEASFLVKQEAENGSGDYNDYDTTLTLAVFINDAVYYGQIGDSGIIALREDGKFERITEEQLGEGIGKDRPVYPLAAVSRWVFKSYIPKAKALFLATDGVLKKLQPPILEGQAHKLNHKYLAYVFNKLEPMADDREAGVWIKGEVIQTPPEEVDFDDKTLAVLISKAGSLQTQAPEYYRYPTDELWNNLSKNLEEELYPYRKKPQSPEDPPSKDEDTHPSPATQVKKGNQGTAILPPQGPAKQGDFSRKEQSPVDGKNTKPIPRWLIISTVFVVIVLVALIYLLMNRRGY